MKNDLNALIKDFAQKYTVKEILFASREGMPIAYYNENNSANKEVHILSAEASSLIAIAQTLTTDVDHVTVSNGVEKIIVIGDNDYVLKIKSEGKRTGIITMNGKKLFERLRAIISESF